MLSNQAKKRQLISSHRKTLPAARTIMKDQYIVLSLCLFIVLLFCQAWIEVAGFTIRAEDVLALALLANLLLPTLSTGKLRYYRNSLNLPLLLWSCVLLLSIIVTLFYPFDSVTKKNALVNGIRLILAVGIFFIVNHHPSPAEVKLRTVVFAVIGFSLVTTAVMLFQMGYWDGWLPIQLPEVLTTFKEGANTAKGRELFALYLGDTGSHTWSGALAMQALLVWVLRRYLKRPWRKWIAWLYFGLLVFILIRISVRNSILGLFVAIVALGILRGLRTHDFLLRVLRPFVLGIIVVILLYVLLYVAPDTYFVERVRQVIPRFENGTLVISRGSNVYGRLDYWAIAIEIFATSPIIGRGFYSYQALSGLFFPDGTVHAHNSYFQALAELGGIGVIAMSWLMVRIGCYLYRSRHCFKPHEIGKFWWEFTAGSFIFLAFSMVFSNTFWFPNYVAFRMVVLGVLASLVRERVG